MIIDVSRWNVIVLKQQLLWGYGTKVGQPRDKCSCYERNVHGRYL